MKTGLLIFLRKKKFSTFRCFLLSGILYIIPSVASAQAELTDSIQYARSLAYQKNFAEANQVLTAFNSTKNDLQGLRLQALVLYWMQQFHEANEVHDRAVRTFPEEWILKKEYGSFLYEWGRYKKAERFLSEYLIHHPIDRETHIQLGFINLWNGKLQAAMAHGEAVLKQDTANEEAIHIIQQIQAYSAPYVQLTAGMFSDDQPLSGNFQEMQSGWYRSSIFSPVVSFRSISNNVPDGTVATSWLQLSNHFSFNWNHTSLYIKGGAFLHKGTQLTGAAALTQKVSKSFSLTATAERRPYQYTIASIGHPLLQNHFSAGVGLNNHSKWLGKAAYEVQQFDDKNRVRTSYLWLLLPVISGSVFDLKAGYSFNHSTSDVNSFRTKQPLETISTPSYLNRQLEGIYDPYFTPQNQQVHSALATFTIKPSDGFSLAFRSSVGVHATAENPTLTLKQKTNAYYVEKSFGVTAFTPRELTADMHLSVSQQFSFKGSYTYSSLFFYTRHAAQLMLKYSFL